MKKILHAGCGTDTISEHFGKDYIEIRLDIDDQYNPDIVASITDLGDIGEFDAIYCSHALEHVFPHECEQALREFYRVLKPGGAAIIFTPDVEDVKPNEDFLYTSPIGDVTGMDIIYGFRKYLKDYPYMAHKNGFTSDTLERELLKAGFSKVIMQRLGFYQLSAVAQK